MKISIARRIGAAVTLVFATALCAADTEAPAGPVVLTVAGNIANTNRPAYNEKRDVFLKYHERTFDKAFEFDRVMLERLGVTQIRIEYERWDGPITFSGPRLAEVLKAAGWRGGALVTLGLDGYSTRISAAEVEARRPGPMAVHWALAREARSGWSSTRWGSGRLPRMSQACGRGRCSLSSVNRSGLRCHSESMDG